MRKFISLSVFINFLNFLTVDKVNYKAGDKIIFPNFYFINFFLLQ